MLAGLSPGEEEQVDNRQKNVLRRECRQMGLELFADVFCKPETSDGDLSVARGPAELVQRLLGRILETVGRIWGSRSGGEGERGELRGGQLAVRGGLEGGTTWRRGDGGRENQKHLDRYNIAILNYAVIAFGLLLPWRLFSLLFLEIYITSANFSI